MGFSSLSYVFFVLELSLVFFGLSVIMAPFNRVWAQIGYSFVEREGGYTVVAGMITELIRFEPEICICNGN